MAQLGADGCSRAGGVQKERGFRAPAHIPWPWAQPLVFPRKGPSVSMR